MATDLIHPAPARDLAPAAVGSRGGQLPALFAAALAALLALTWPVCLSFSDFAYGDMGATLAAEALQDQGYRPTVDFCHPYGLLTLLVGRIGFGALGASPASYVALMVACNALVGWALVRLVRALRVGRAGLALLLLTLPFTAPATHPNLVYALEAPLLCHALAEHARGRRDRALALVAACSLVKPTMAYLYGLLLVVAILATGRGRRGPAGAWWRPFLPAAAAGLGLVLLLAAAYGPDVLANSLLFPFVHGSTHYRIEGFGFLRAGRHFWAPPGAGPGYYLGTIAGLWIAATLYVVAAAVVALVRDRGAAGDGLPGFNAEVQACCAAMQLGFIALFFAHAWSWFFYFYILMIGVVATPPRLRTLRALTWALVVLAVPPTIGRYRERLRTWATTAPWAEARGLWITPEERRAWSEALDLAAAGGARPVFLTFSGGAEALDRRFAPPTALWLYRGLALPAEVARTRARVAGASAVVVQARNGLYPDVLAYWPEFAEALRGRERVYDGPTGLRVYLRPGAAARGVGATGPTVVLASPGRRQDSGRMAAPPDGAPR